MKHTLTALIYLFVASLPLSAQSIDVKTVKTSKGDTYTNATISKRNDYEASIIHDAGTGRLPIEILPENIRTKLKFDPVKAEAAKVKVEKERQASEKIIAGNIAELEESKRLAQKKKAEATAQNDSSEEKPMPNRPTHSNYTGQVQFTQKELLAFRQCAYIYTQLQDSGSTHFKLAKKMMEDCKDPKLLDNPSWPSTIAEASYKKLSIKDSYARGVPPNGFTEQREVFSASDATRSSRKKKEDAKINLSSYRDECAKLKARLEKIK